MTDWEVIRSNFTKQLYSKRTQHPDKYSRNLPSILTKYNNKNLHTLIDLTNRASKSSLRKSAPCKQYKYYQFTYLHQNIIDTTQSKNTCIGLITLTTNPYKVVSKYSKQDSTCKNPSLQTQSTLELYINMQFF